MLSTRRDETMPLWIRGEEKTGVTGSELRAERRQQTADSRQQLGQSVGQPLRRRMVGGWRVVYRAAVAVETKPKSGVGCLIGEDARRMVAGGAWCGGSVQGVGGKSRKTRE